MNVLIKSVNSDCVFWLCSLYSGLCQIKRWFFRLVVPPTCTTAFLHSLHNAAFLPFLFFWKPKTSTLLLYFWLGHYSWSTIAICTSSLTALNCFCFFLQTACDPLSEATQLTTVCIKFSLPMIGLPSSVEAQSVPPVLQLQSFSLRVPDTATVSTAHMLHVDLCEIFEYAHLKFTVIGQSKQASKHRYTNVCNAVTLVWGSLKLAPMMSSLLKNRCPIWHLITILHWIKQLINWLRSQLYHKCPTH